MCQIDSGLTWVEIQHPATNGVGWSISPCKKAVLEMKPKMIPENAYFVPLA